MKIIERYRSSLPRSLSLLAVLLASAVFFAALAFMFDQAREAVKREAMERATQILDNTVQRADNILSNAETATANTLWQIKRQLNQKDSMEVYAKAFMESNPFMQGCSIAFEPYFFKEQGRYFSMYAGKDEDGTLSLIHI